jgi:di/tricarboxylate transporter
MNRLLDAIAVGIVAVVGIGGLSLLGWLFYETFPWQIKLVACGCVAFFWAMDRLHV